MSVKIDRDKKRLKNSEKSFRLKYKNKKNNLIKSNKKSKKLLNNKIYIKNFIKKNRLKLKKIKNTRIKNKKNKIINILNLENINKTNKYGWIRIKLPLKKGTFWISSRYGIRKEPSGRIRLHGGVDLAAVRGTPIFSVANGIVKRAEVLKGYGNCIILKHDNGVETRYGHLSKILVSEGSKIIEGQKIGLVGATGNVRGKGDPSHLHFELIIDGIKQDPLNHFIW